MYMYNTLLGFPFCQKIFFRSVRLIDGRGTFGESCFVILLIVLYIKYKGTNNKEYFLLSRFLWYQCVSYIAYTFDT